MASSETTPRRRFLPQPVETSARSTKRQQIEKPQQSPTEQSNTTDDQEKPIAKSAKPRKFLPQPIEETARVSKKNDVQEEKSTDSADKPSSNASQHYSYSDDNAHPGYPTSRPATSRRFAPEPVETTARTSRRKFAVEPTKTSSRSSKETPEKEKSPLSRPRRKFAPEPVETTTVRRRQKDTDEDSNQSPPDSPSESSSIVSSRRSTGSRRFSPELIETAKGTYKKDSDSPRSSHVHFDKPSSPPRHMEVDIHEPEDPCESRFSAASLAKRTTHEARRQHSYCVPDLPMIESESSGDESDPPSLTDTPSTTDNEHNRLPVVEESKRETYTAYVLSLAQSRDRRKLEEQAMAAYINERPYEPVAHYDLDEEEEVVGTLSAKEGADPRTFRRSSQAEHDWEMENMRRHHEMLEKAKKELHDDTAGASRFSAAALASRHHQGQVHRSPTRAQKKKDEDAEYARMKKAASPPMLGDDLIFPYTVSPKMTRCDIDQAPRPRRADSDDEDRSTGISTPTLWSAQGGSQSKANAGLWMGSCQKPPEPSRPPTPIRSGLQTPAYESSNPFESRTPGRGSRTPGRARPFSGMHLAPLTPARSHGNSHSEDDFTSSIDKKLRLEKQIEEEFPPRVVTQIYNYLSLGFPSIARDFDPELSKISRVSLKDLRKDDHTATGTIKGHVGAPESELAFEQDEDGTIRGCKRWDALRLYVKEWARQSPNFTVEQTLPVVQDPTLAHVRSIRADAWGSTVRRGSWAQ